MKKIFLLTLFFLQILRGVTTAQNPYKSIGKTTEVLTLSNGKYQEFFPNDTIVRIGSVLFNRVTNEVVEFLTEKDSSSLVEADVASRFLSVDPIGRAYPELTPYQFAGNTPIQAIDLDGLEPLVATDYGTLEQLKTKINITYSTELLQGKESTTQYNKVTVSNTYNGTTVEDALDDREYSQEDLKAVKKDTWWQKLGAGLKYPQAAYNRSELEQIKSMSYRDKSDGKRGMAFGDISLELYKRTQNKGKGTLENTYLHVSGQALITILFGKGVANFTGHLHERSQGSLITGQFAPKEMSQAIDNYADLINNQWGQVLGGRINSKFNVSSSTVWDNNLSANVLNEMQGFYGEMMGKTFNSTFKPDEKYVKDFTEFMNTKK